MAKLGFKDFLSVDYTQSGDGQLAKNAKKRKLDTPTGNTGEAVEPENEALSMAQRMKRSRNMKKYQSRLKLGRKKQEKKFASKERLMKRSRKAARVAVRDKLYRDIKSGDLTPAKKAEIEKRLDKMKPRIDRLAKKMLPKIRKKEQERRRG